MAESLCRVGYVDNFRNTTQLKMRKDVDRIGELKAETARTANGTRKVLSRGSSTSEHGDDVRHAALMDELCCARRAYRQASGRSPYYDWVGHDPPVLPYRRID